jgi:hypothetical protein
MGDLPGAYGLRVSGAVGDLLVAAPPHWPLLSLSQEIGEVERGEEDFDEEYAELSLVDGWASLRRDPASVTFTFRRLMSEGEIAHPYLTRVAAAHTYWLGRESFHAGAFIANGRAWAIAADRGGGKSSTLAGLASGGHPIVVDDLVVTSGGKILAGPRSIDLREGASTFLGLGEPMGIHGGRTRFRHRLDDVPAEIELGGWIFLSWDESVDAVQLSPFDRLRRLMDHRMVKGPAQLEPSGVLNLAALPGFELKRPRSFDRFGDSLAAIAEIVA